MRITVLDLNKIVENIIDENPERPDRAAAPLDIDGGRIPDGACSTWSEPAAAAFEELLEAYRRHDGQRITDRRLLTGLRAAFAEVFAGYCPGSEVRR